MTPMCKKHTHSGYRVVEIIAELDTSLLAKDLERSCCLAAELSCTGGGQARKLVLRLLDIYCARCVNSNHAQLTVLRSALIHIGEGSTKSPGDMSCHEQNFRKGLCMMVLLVACSSKDHARDVSAAFARVPNMIYSEDVKPALRDTIRSLRLLTGDKDAHAVSSIIRGMSYDGWHGEVESLTKGTGLGMPDVQRLRACFRKDPIWCIWSLARELASVAKVLGYVDNCLHAFAWGFNRETRKSRIHLLWYAFLVIIKGAVRGGPHDVEPAILASALDMINGVFEDVLLADKHDGLTKDGHQITARSPTHVASLQNEARMQYFETITLIDADKVSRVERDRKDASAMSNKHDQHSIRTKIICV